MLVPTGVAEGWTVQFREVLPSLKRRPQTWELSLVGGRGLPSSCPGGQSSHGSLESGVSRLFRAGFLCSSRRCLSVRVRNTAQTCSP